MNVACYVRVSTEEQSVDRQLCSVHEYAETQLGAELDDVLVYRDTATGTDVDRDDYREMMADVRANVFDAVVVHSISRIARSIRDFDQAVEEIVEEHDTALHIISENFQLRPGDDDPYQRAMLQLLGVFAELEARLAQKRTREGLRTRMENEEYHHGPAPLGFKKDDGHLIEGANYDRVRSVLELVREDELSKRKAARELDTSRRTINRALDRAELYGLAG